MNIFIDVRLASYSYQGIKTYIDSILPYLLREDSNTYFLCGFRDYITKYSTYKNVKIIPFEAPINSFKEQILGFKLKRKLKKIIDVYFFPYPCIPFCFLNENFVVKLYDVTPFRFFYFYNPLKVVLGFILTLLIAKRANKIIAVSNATANDIIKYFRISNKKIIVIYCGVTEEKISFSSAELQQFKVKYSLNRFVLYVGNREKTKNIFRVIEALKLLRRDGIDIDFVIVGRFFEKYKRIDKKILKHGSWIKIFYDVDKEELLKFYKTAELYVHAALNEGFGLPVLEAIKCGCVCAVSDIKVFRELYDNACVFFNPYSIFDIYLSIKKLLYDDNLKEILKKNALEILNNFSWEQTAKSLLNILKKAGRRNEL